MNKASFSIAFQGETGAFSEMAAKRFFNSSKASFITCNNFEKVFKTVKNKADYGIIPIENSLAGSIHQNYDLMLQYQIPIIGEIKLRISHCLIGHKKTRPQDIRRVYSHPQALEQCKKYLSRLKKAEVIPAYDTAGAVKMLKENGDTSAAAIAGRQAAVDYGMHIIREGIENNRHNFTRFLIISKKDKAKKAPAARTKTSIVFAPMRNIPGFLFKSLSVFAMRDIDLLKIESRPLHGQPWQYHFYLDFQGDAAGEAGRNAIAHLKEITTFVKILGSYPKGREVTAIRTRRT